MEKISKQSSTPPVVSAAVLASPQVTETRELSSTGDPRALARVEQSPFVDIRVYADKFNRQALVDQLAVRMKTLVATAKTGPLEKQVLDCNANKPVLVTNRAQALYQQLRSNPACKDEAYRLNLCHWTEKKLQEWFALFSQLNAKTQRYDPVVRWLKDFLTNTLKLEPTQAAEYIDFVGEQIAQLNELKAKPEDRSDDILLGQRIINKYIVGYMVPRELYRQGVYLEEFFPKNKREPIYSLFTPQIDRRALAGFDMPIHRNVYLSGLGEPNLTINRGGNIYVNLEVLEKDALVVALNGRLIKTAFDRLFAARPDVGFYHNPVLLLDYFTANIYRALDKGTNQDEFRDRYLDYYLREDMEAMVIRAFLDSYLLKHNGELFWGARSSLEQEAMPMLFKDDSQLLRIYRELTKEYPTDDITKLDNSQASWVVNDFLNLEAKLRVLADDNYDSRSVFADAISSIVMHPIAEEGPNVRQIDNRHPKYVTETLMVKLLTEELIPNGQELSAQVNWQKLCRSNFHPQSPDSFNARWRQYIANPALVEDPEGLLQLRAAWYKFFDNELGRFDKFDIFMQSKRLQKAAAKILDREYISYRNRGRQFPNWQEYFKTNLAFRPRDRKLSVEGP